MQALAYLTPYLWRYKYHLLGGTFFILLSNVLAIVPAWLARESLDIVAHNLRLYRLFDQPHQVLTQSILFFGLLIIGFALVRGLFMFFMRQTVIVMSRHIEYELKNNLYAHLQSLPPAFYTANKIGDLLARISEDVSRVRMYLGPAIMYGVNLLTLFGLVIPFMFYINTRLALYTLLPLPLLSLSIYWVNNTINRKSERIQAQLSALSAYAQEAFSGIRIIKSFVRENAFVQHFTQASQLYFDRTLSLARVEALFFPLMLFLIGMSTVLVVYVGSLEVMAGQVSVGNIAEFIIYISLLSWPVASLGWASSLVQRAAASQERLKPFACPKTYGRDW